MGGGFGNLRERKKQEGKKREDRGVLRKRGCGRLFQWKGTDGH